VLMVTVLVLLALAGLSYWVLLKLHYHPVGHWPFMMK
jgi:hypothetical protein